MRGSRKASWKKWPRAGFNLNGKGEGRGCSEQGYGNKNEIDFCFLESNDNRLHTMSDLVDNWAEGRLARQTGPVFSVVLNLRLTVYKLIIIIHNGLIEHLSVPGTVLCTLCTWILTHLILRTAWDAIIIIFFATENTGTKKLSGLPEMM